MAGMKTCPVCHGRGTYEGQIGGDGYGGRCCAVADVELVCLECMGTGQVEMETTFKLCWHGRCLTNAAGWEYEPMPSSRDDAFYLRCRFDTLEQAVETWNRANARLQRRRPRRPLEGVVIF
jgi:hypothetical protein